jgi:hypothetical protein
MKRYTFNKLRKIAFDNPNFTNPAESWGMALNSKPKPKPEPAKRVVESYPDATDMIQYLNNSRRLQKKLRGNASDRRSAAAFANRVGLPQFGVVFRAGWSPDYAYPKLLTKWNDNANKLFTAANFANMHRSDGEVISPVVGGHRYTKHVSPRDLVNFNPKGSDPVLNTYKLYNPDGSDATLPVFRKLHESRMRNRAALSGESYDPSKVYTIPMSAYTGVSVQFGSRNFSMNAPVIYAVPNNRTVLGSKLGTTYAAMPYAGAKEGYGVFSAGRGRNRLEKATTTGLHEGLTGIFGHAGTPDDSSWGTADPDTRVLLSGGYGDVNAVNQWFRDSLRRDYPNTVAPESLLTHRYSKYLRSNYGPLDRQKADELQRRVLNEHNQAVKTGKWQPETFLGYGNSLSELGTYGNNIKNIAAIRDGVLLDYFDDDYMKDRQTSESGLLNFMVSKGFWKDNWADPNFDRNSGYRFSPGDVSFSRSTTIEGSPGALNSDIVSSEDNDGDLGERDLRDIINHYFYLKNLGDRRTEEQTEEMLRAGAILGRGMETW